MLDSTIATNLPEIFKTAILPLLSEAFDHLIQGSLLACEHTIINATTLLHNEVMCEFTALAAAEFVEAHQAPEGCKTRLRPHSIVIATGKQIQLSSPYYRELGCDYQGNRRPIADHWGLINTFSPLFYDRVGFLSMLAPSYDLANQALKKFGTACCISTTRKVTNALAEKCSEVGQENLIIQPDETLAGKRVVISSDGGRTRIRQYTGQFNANGQAHYDTLWREPKLFVIDILDEHGRPSRKELPIYGCKFSEEDMLESLRGFLSRLEIQQAEHVQLIADGAPWIWNKVPALLNKLGVSNNRLTLTLDYYHCSQYVHEIVEAMPKRITRKERQVFLNDFKKLLTKAKTGLLVKRIKAVFKRPSKLVKRWLAYLERHVNKMQYADYKRLNLMCGSGIVESAVRRVINLRFKNTSTFWLIEHVEHLYFLRGALVAGRWDFVMQNLENR